MKCLVRIFTLLLMTVIVKANPMPCFVITPDFATAYDRAHAVFIGEVVKISKPLTSDSHGPLADRLHKVTFKVEYSWKGAGFHEFGLSELVVLSDQGAGGDCFSWGTFFEGKKYLVYADETPENNLIVHIGNRTALLSSASADLKELRKMDAFFQFRAKPSRR